MNDRQATDFNAGEPIVDIFGYEILHELGQGGQGLVYKARQLATGQLVAIKAIHAHSSGPAPRARARFLREIRISASLNHPGIVRLMDSLKLADGRDALVMEYVEGLPLDDWISQHPQVPRSQIIQLIASIADALQHAHHRGVIHRDLKPSNILIDPSGQPHILDFGVARRNEGGDLNDRVTLTGEFTGTLAYAAPEQVRDDQAAPDIRSDIYALGLIACKVLTGELPYKVDGSLDSAVRNIIDAEPSRRFHIGLEPDHWAVIAKAIAKEPERRYQSASEMASDLRNAACGDAIAARGTQRWYVLRKATKKHRLAISLLIAVLLGLSTATISIAVGNARLSESLRLSRIQQLRSYIESNARGRAETILWSEAERGIPHRTDGATALWSAPLNERELRWAFMEMQDRATCLYAGRIDGVGTVVNFDPLNDGRFAVLSTDQRIGWLSITDDRLEFSPGIQLASDTYGGLFTPSGRYAVTLSNDLLRCIDTQSGATLGSITVANSLTDAGSLCVSDWGAAFNSSQGDLTVMTLPGLDALYTTSGLPRTQQVWLDPREQLVAFVGSDGLARILDLVSGSESFPLDEPVSESGKATEFPQVFLDANHETLIVAHSERVLIAGSSGGRSTLRNLAREGYRISASLNHQGTILSAQAYGDSALRLWDIGTGEELPRLSGHAGAVHLHAFSTDDTRILTIDRASIFRIWATPGHGWRHALGPHASNTHQFGMTNHGHSILAADPRHPMVILKAYESDPTHVVHAPMLPINPVRFAGSNHSGRVAAADLSNRITILNLEIHDPVPMNTVLKEGDSTTGMDFGLREDGREVLAVCTHQGRVLLIDPIEPVGSQVVASVVLGDGLQLSDLRWSPDATTIAVSCRDGRVAVLDPYTLSVRSWFLASQQQIRTIAYSPDAGTIAAAGDSGQIAMIDVQSGQIRNSGRISEDSLFTIAYHPSGQIMVLGNRAGRITIVDTSTTQVLATFHTKGAVMSIRFSVDGSSIFVAALGCPIERWDLATLADTFERLRPSEM